MRSLLPLLLLACRPEPEVGPAPTPPADTGVSQPAPAYMKPVAVGFEFDGILQQNGSLTGYWLDDEYYPPTVFVIFASDEFFSASSEEVETEQACYAWGSWSPQPNASFPNVNGAILHSAYEGFLTLEYHSCAGLLNPEEWGEDGLELIYQFQGMHLGMGFGKLTPSLSEAWSDEILDLYRPNMFATYFAFNDADQFFVAEDLTTSFAWEVDASAEALASDEFGYLLPVTVEDLSPSETLPQAYVRSIATWYPLFEAFDLDNLDANL